MVPRTSPDLDRAVGHHQPDATTVSVVTPRTEARGHQLDDRCLRGPLVDRDLADVVRRAGRRKRVRVLVKVMMAPPYPSWSRSRAGSRWSGCGEAEVVRGDGPGRIGPNCRRLHVDVRGGVNVRATVCSYWRCRCRRRSREGGAAVSIVTVCPAGRHGIPQPGTPTGVRWPGRSRGRCREVLITAPGCLGAVSAAARATSEWPRPSVVGRRGSEAEATKDVAFWAAAPAKV